MNKKKAFLNILLSFVPQIINLVFAILAKRFLISEVGNDANGFYQLFLSITSLISIVELGVGGGIIFCMYAPIANGDLKKVSGLYYFFRKMYFIIGLIILVIGLAITPAIPYLAKDYTLTENVYVCYILSVVFTFLPYLFSYKSHLVNAYKDNYISSIVSAISLAVQYILQIVAVIVFKTLLAYVAAKVVSVFIQWILTNISVRKHKDVIDLNERIDDETKKEVNKNIKAMFANRIGYTLINTTDSIFISVFVSVAILGFYSNYISLSATLSTFLVSFFAPLNSIIGSIFVTRKKEVGKYLSFFHTLNFLTGMVFYLGYYAVIDNFINFFYGYGLLLDRMTVKVLVIMLYIQYMRQAILTFRDATGSYVYDKYRPIIEGVVNIILDFVLVNAMGIMGVFIATIATNLCISYVVEPYVVEKIVLEESPKRYYIKSVLFLAIFVGCVFGFDYIAPSEGFGEFVLFLFRGFIAVGVAVAIGGIYLIFDKNFRVISKDYLSFLFKRHKKEEVQ